MDQDCLTVAEVLAHIGLTRDQLNLLRKQEYITTVEAQKGGRKVWVYPKDQLPKLTRMAELIKGGVKPQAAAQRSDEEIASGQLPREIPTTVDLRPQVEGKEVGRLLAALHRPGVDLQAQIDLFTAIFPSLPKPSDAPPANSNPSDYLARTLAGFEYLDFVQVRTLAQLLGVHPLLVDPLFSQVEDDRDWLALDQRQFVPVGDRRDPNYGSHVQYYLPPVRLSGTDAMLAVIALEPKGQSCTHAHAGDELVLCLEGELTVRLQSSGNIALRPFEYVHFDSDQEHLLRNDSLDRPARVLIVRFYQIDRESPSTRERVRQLLQEEPASQELLARVAPWLPKPIPTPNHAPRITVQDRLGFGKFLANLRDLAGARPEQTAERLAKAMQDVSSDKALDLVRAYEAGSVEVVKEDFEAIANAYQVNEFLFHSYLSQAVPGAVVVRGLFRPFLEEEFRKLEEREESPTTGRKSTYWTPLRMLLHSDITIVRVQLEPGGFTHENKHPGFEVSIVLDGRISVKFPEDGQEVSGSPENNQILMYSSERTHKVVNDSNAPATFVAIRFSARWGRPARDA